MHDSLHFSTEKHPFRDHQTKATDGSVAQGSSWTLQYRNGQKQRQGRKKEGERERQGRESPECKAMFSRNVLPPVLSCNLTGNSPESCLTETRRGREGGRKSDGFGEREMGGGQEGLHM